MKIINNLTFKALLKTQGRKTGKEHTVWAKAVTYNDMIYFSRRNPNSDWLKNAIAHPQVKVEFNGNKFSGLARLVEEAELVQKISNLKYSEESRQKEARIVLEIKLTEND
jgi:deazaflavin-dependent oxidoreductase (nitroreductase family)